MKPKSKPAISGNDIADEIEQQTTGIVCVLGLSGAIAIKEFVRTFKKTLPREAADYLIRAWSALEVMPRDASAEKHLLRDALCKLRDEWQ